MSDRRVQVELVRGVDLLFPTKVEHILVWLPVGVKAGSRVRLDESPPWTVERVYNLCVRDLDAEKEWQ